MKIALILFLFSSSLIGVFGDTDAVKSVSVMEGGSVTLHTGVTKIQGSDSIEWRFKGTRMARINSDASRTEGPFRDTMKLNSQTGDLKITNITTTDSGFYKLKIKSSSGSPEMTFSVTVIPGVKSVSVMEGDSVTLNTNVNGLQRDDEIQWRHQNILVAAIDNNDVQRYRDRLELDRQTGSLTITNITTEDAGDYEVDVTISSRSRYTIHKSFSVNINNEQKSVSVMEGDSVTLNSGLTEIQRDDVIRWSFGKTVIAEIIKADERFFTDDGPDGRFRCRLKFDHRTGSLTITNTRNTDSGEYGVEIISSRFTIHKRIIITIDGVFGDSVTVMEGDSVTLHTDVPKIQRADTVEWRLNGVCIAKISMNSTGHISDWVSPDEAFRDRLQLDRKTGDLKITKFRTTDSGHYLLGSQNKTFNLKCVSDGVKVVSVMERDSVVLNTGVTKIQRDDQITWRFIEKAKIIALAKINAEIPSVYNDVLDRRFKNRLQLNHQTGSLIITNVRLNISGLYEADIYKSSRSYTTHKIFNVTAFEGEIRLSEREGNSVTLQINLTEIQRDDEIQWRFEHGDSVIAKINNGSFTTFDGDDGRFKGRLKLDHQTGSLTITNIRAEHSGLYHVDINGRKCAIFKRIILSVCPKDSSTARVWGITVAVAVGAGVIVLLALLAGVVAVRYFKRTTYREASQREGES